MEIQTKSILGKWEEEIKARIDILTIPAVLNIIQVGSRNDSNLYVKNKIKKAESLGIRVNHIHLDSDVEQRKLNKIISGMDSPTILQLPLPDHLSAKNALTFLNPYIDVDGLTSTQQGLLVSNDKRAFPPATALGVLKILENLCELEGKRVCIVSRSHLIGKPLIQLILNSNAYPVVLHTRVPADKFMMEMLRSDIVVTGCGKRALFDSKFFKDGQILIDCSMEKVEGIPGVGDLDKEDILKHVDCVVASGYGHTGPATILGLMDNVVKYYEQ